MTESFTFLFAPIDAVGHIHACIGLAQQLVNRGHKVVFVIRNSWKGKLEPLGFVEKCIQDPADTESMDKWSEETLTAMSPLLPLTPLKKQESLTVAIYAELIKRVKESYPKMLEIMNEVKPDVVVVDDVIHNPALVDQGRVLLPKHCGNPFGNLLLPY